MGLKAADELVYNLPIVLILIANLQVILFWVELTGAGAFVSVTGLTRLKPALYGLTVVFAAVSLTLALWAAFDTSHEHLLLFVYNAWTALWVLGLAVALVVWGRRSVSLSSTLHPLWCSSFGLN